MSDSIPEEVMKAARLALMEAETHAGRQNQIRIIAAAILAERERCASWHDVQAEALEAALDEIRAAGGWVDTARRAAAEQHRRSASAIRSSHE